MIVLLKIIYVFILISVGVNFVETNNIICYSTSFLAIVYLLADLRYRYCSYIDGDYNEPYGYYSQASSSRNKYVPISYIDNSFSYYDTEIKSVESKIKLCNNIVSIGESKITYKDMPKDSLSVNNFEPNKPLIDIKSIDSELHENSNDIDINNSKDLILIDNNDNISDKTKKVFDIIINALDLETLKPDEKYVLLQSFYTIDICPKDVVIYINERLLSKINANDSLINTNLIKTNIQNSLGMNTIFCEYKGANLLDYYIK